MAHDVVVNGVTFPDVDMLEMTSTSGEKVAFYPDAVRYNPQSLTDPQKAQARANIGAVSEAELNEQVGALSDEIGAYSTLTLGIHTDGLIYVFKDGKPIGSGIKLPEGGLPGYVDSAGNIVLEGEYPDGTRVKYVLKDGSLADIGGIELLPGMLDFTDLVPTAIDSTGEIMGGKGYLRDYRITATVGNSYSGTTIAKSAAGFTIVGLMNVGNILTGDVYVYGLEFSGASSDKIVTYDNSTYKCKYAAELLTDGFSDGKVTATKLGDLYYKLSLSFVSSFQNIAISGHTGDSGIEPIVTLNQPIFKE